MKSVTYTNNTIVLGRENDSDKVRIFGLGATGSTQLCRNADNEISTCSSSLRYKTNIAPTGEVAINVLGTGGATSLCRNASNQISTCSSSMRYKSNVNPFGSGLSLVKKLRPVSFNWKDNNLADLGLVAEEVNKVEPLLTTVNEKGETEGVKYDRVGVVLINAVQEQQTQIEVQQRQIDEQKDLIRRQEEKLTRQQTEIDALKVLVCSNNKAAEICRPKN